MCYMENEERRRRYKILRDLGVSRSWSQRVRDFTEPKFNLYLRFGYNHRDGKPISEG